MDLLHLMYQLRSGHYYLYDMRDAPNAITGERPYRLKTELVAIAFDRITGRVHQHGPPTRIHSWAMGAQRRLRMGFCNRMTSESTRTGCLCWPMRRDGCRVAAYALPGLRFVYRAGRVSKAPPAHASSDTL